MQRKQKLSMKDVLLWSQGEPPRPGPRRIGIHTSTSGGVEQAAERAYRLGANAFQIFSSSPRQWKPYSLATSQCEQMRRLREKYDIAPLVIHSSYLVNLASSTPVFHRKSVEAFRGELERAIALGAEFLVLHPGSFRGRSREEGLELVAASIAEAAPIVCPSIDLIELMGIREALSPKTRLTAIVSKRSFVSVPVPCALM